MEYLSIRTRGNSTPERKPRVYFTCHPDDFARYFDTVCEDVFKTQDCAVYYTTDMTAPLPEEYIDTDLGSMNLFVVPVTFRLLTEPNRAMDSDIAFALEKHVPILPLMMETGIDEFYAEKFGKLQYLSPYIHDLTAISYEEKLRKYLASILIDDETAEKVRAAFDAYIFLSYRKKDRQYANELMKLIHTDPKYQDIAIWYDEFLTPGESFSDSIEKMLEKSDLFTLLVTPNLVNEENYVKSVEYPAAKQANKKVLPAEMVETDADELKKQYDGIPDVVKAKDDAALRESLAQAFASYARRENDDDPMHNYLIGLAYLEGIDVEVNREKAVELITKAAEAELPEAMEKIGDIYEKYENIEYKLKYHYWKQKLADYYIRKLGENNPITLAALMNLAHSYGRMEDDQKKLELYEKVYALRCEVFGENDPDTLGILYRISVTYMLMGDRPKALEIRNKIYNLAREIYGGNSQEAVRALSVLAGTYSTLQDYKKAIELYKKVYEFRRKTNGIKDPDTLMVLNTLAVTYGNIGDHKKALELQESVYSLQCEVLGEKHPDALQSLDSLADAYQKNGNSNKELELREKEYSIICEILDEKQIHYDKELEIQVMLSIDRIAETYRELENYRRVFEIYNKMYLYNSEAHGEIESRTLSDLIMMTTAYEHFGDIKESLVLREKIYKLHCDKYGEKHIDTINSLSTLAETYREYGDRRKALELDEKVYALQCEVLGEKHPDTLTSLSDVAYEYYDLKEYLKALKYYDKLYVICCDIFGEDHPKAQKVKEKLEACRKKLAGSEE